jgi:hypothetical protein
MRVNLSFTIANRCWPRFSAVISPRFLNAAPSFGGICTPRAASSVWQLLFPLSSIRWTKHTHTHYWVFSPCCVARLSGR